MEQRFELGQSVEDTASGFRGTVVGITEWLGGQAIYTVQPWVSKDGKLPESQAFTAGRLRVALFEDAPPMSQPPPIKA